MPVIASLVVFRKLVNLQHIENKYINTKTKTKTNNYPVASINKPFTNRLKNTKYDTKGRNWRNRWLRKNFG